MREDRREALLKTIVARKKFNGGRTVRLLECGHEQPERSGGFAYLATSARCFTCEPPDAHGAQEPIGVCTAFVFPLAEGKARPCGRPAYALKRGQPRCPLHRRKGAR